MLKLGQIYNRTAEAEEILRFLSNPAERLLLVTGESGCGKSTVVEKALTQADERRSIPANPSCHTDSMILMLKAKLNDFHNS